MSIFQTISKTDKQLNLFVVILEKIIFTPALLKLSKPQVTKMNEL